MTKEIKYQLNDKTILVQVTTHNDFVNCIEDNPSPFKNSKILLSPETNIDEFEKVVIKCFLEKSQRTIILSERSESGEAICHQIAEQFIKENWTNKELKQIETINCSHFEQQYKYIIIKK
jgi:hypothetical protein